MNYQDLVEKMTPDIYAKMRRAIESGSWPDGRQLSEQQREDTMQAIIAYDQLNLPEQERTGFIHKGRKEGEQCDDEPQTLTFEE